jgi:hypothetical protein
LTYEIGAAKAGAAAVMIARETTAEVERMLDQIDLKNVEME